MQKINSKHFVFKASIAETKTCFLMDKGSEAKLIDKYFVHTQKISTFKLKKKIKLMLKNGKTLSKLDKKMFN